MNMSSKWIRLLRESQTARFFLPFGLIALVMGVINIPGVAENGNKIWAVVFLLIGLLCIIGAVISLSQVVQKERERTEQEAEFQQHPEEQEAVRATLSGEETGYMVKPDKSLTKQGYFMEDKNGVVVYEAKCTKRSLTSMDFDFVNRVAGSNTPHKVGLTTATGDGLIAKSSFKFDGVNVWDVLHQKGIRVEQKLHKTLGSTYTVSLKGVEIGTMESSLKYANQLQMVTASTELDLLFLTAFAILRTEQTVVD